MPSNTKYYASIDFETSDLNGVPVEIGFVLYDIKTESKISHFQRYMKLKDGEEISQEAFEAHGLTKEFLNDNGVEREKAFAEIWYWLESLGIKIPSGPEDEYHNRQIIPMGHNIIEYDFDVMLAWSQEAGFLGQWKALFTYTKIDTLHDTRLINRVCIKAFGWGSQPFRDPETGYPSAKLEHVAHWIGLDCSKAHSALWDAEAVWAIFKYHNSTLSGDLKKSADCDLMDKGGDFNRESDPGIFCPNCGTRFKESTNCIVCGKNFVIYEEKEKEWIQL